MRHLISIFLLLFSAIAYGQDLIVTTAGDSLKCKIVEVNAGEIQFRFGTGGIISIQRNEVMSYQYNFTTTRNTPAVTPQPASALTTVPTGTLFTKRKKVYQLDREMSESDFIKYRKLLYNEIKPLPQNEARSVMANTLALQMYNKGFKRNSWGNILMIGGAVVAGVGGYIYMNTPSSRYSGEIEYISGKPVQENGYYMDWGNNQYYRYNSIYHAGGNKNVGVAIFLSGAATAITGAVIKSTGKGLVKKSANMYNDGLNHQRTGMEFDFGVTGNSVCLSIRF